MPTAKPDPPDPCMIDKTKPQPIARASHETRQPSLLYSYDEPTRVAVPASRDAQPAHYSLPVALANRFSGRSTAAETTAMGSNAKPAPFFSPRGKISGIPTRATSDLATKKPMFPGGIMPRSLGQSPQRTGLSDRARMSPIESRVQALSRAHPRTRNALRFGGAGLD